MSTNKLLEVINLLEKRKLYSTPTLLIAAKVSFITVMWLTVCLGGPTIWFALNAGVISKIIFLVCLQISLWFIYFLVCLFAHRLSLRSPIKRENFLAKNEDEQGKELGSIIEGY